jgi:amino acid transporter
VAGVFVTFLVITYSALVTAMPRAGGDYTWQSRILGGGPAFVVYVVALLYRRRQGIDLRAIHAEIPVE